MKMIQSVALLKKRCAMMVDRNLITFKMADSGDKKRIKTWLGEDHVKEYWDKTKEVEANFCHFIEGNKDRFDYWVVLYDDKPIGLIRVCDAKNPDPKTGETVDYLAVWLEPEGETWIIDLIIGEKSFLGKGLSDLIIHQFGQTQKPYVTAFLVDPEVKNEKALHIYEKAGFTRVSTFIQGQGFFKGKPHYLLKLKI